MKKIVLSFLLLAGVTSKADWPDVSGWLSVSQRAAAIAKEIPDSVRNILDKIFKKGSGVFTLEQLRIMGFKILSWQQVRQFPGRDIWLGEIAVVEHPDLPGYLLKIPKPDAHATSIARNLTRIFVSEKMRDIIAQNDLNIDVPEKWSYLAKEVPLVVVQKLELKPGKALVKMPELGTKTYNDVLWVAHKLGLWDLHNGNVIPVEGMDRVSFIDTEKFDPAALPQIEQIIGNDVQASIILAHYYKNKQYPWYHWRRYQYADSIEDFNPLIYGVGAVTAACLYVVLVQHEKEVQRIDNVIAMIIISLERITCGANMVLSDEDVQYVCQQVFREYRLTEDVLNSAFIDEVKKAYALHESMQNLRNSIKRAEIIIDAALFQAKGMFYFDLSHGPLKRSMYARNWFFKNTNEADRNKDLANIVNQIGSSDADEVCKIFAEYIALCRTLDGVKKDYKETLSVLKDYVLSETSWYYRMKNSVKSAFGY